MRLNKYVAPMGQFKALILFFLLTPQWFLTWTSDGWSDRFSVDTLYHLAIGLYHASNLNPDPVDGLLVRARREPYLCHIWHDEVNPGTFNNR
jgi:hypothetical protein